MATAGFSTVTANPSDTSAKLFLDALKLALEDDRFKIPSEEAQQAHVAAKHLWAWCSDPSNKAAVQKFADWITKALNSCFERQFQSFKKKQERMWGMYHEIRSSPSFAEKWRSLFSHSIHSSASQSLIQFLTDKVFQTLIRIEYQMLDVSEQESNSSLSFEECNALRYVAGYVSRKIKEKLESSSDDRKNDLVLSLMEITMGDEEDEDIGTESWTNRIDRGGLWHVNDSLYCFFYLLEETIRKHLLLENLGKQAPGSRQALKETILHHEDVQFQWAVVSSSIDEDVSDILKHRFIELYMTIRGFAYASSCLEFYKQQCKSNLQKKKALRKSLCSTTEN